MEKTETINALSTPCFVLYKQELVRSINGFKQALSSHFEKSIVGYSVKTNSLPASMTIAGQAGAYAEVVSYDEYELALACGFGDEHIIYNGPMKSKETFVKAVTGGAIVNIETKRELSWLECLPRDGQYKVGLRLNVNISLVSPLDADGGNDNSRFGFSDETIEFADAVNKIQAMNNVSLAGLHIHRTAHSRSIRFYKNSIEFACGVIEKYQLHLDYLDIGGGYFGIFPNKPTYQEYSDAFYQVLSSHSLERLCVIVEPGNALVASCFSFISEVIDIKNVEPELWMITTDGSRNDIDPFFKKSSYLSELVYNTKSDVVNEQVVCGCTCLEYDRLFSLFDKPRLSVGDRIVYNNVGAYTMCLSPLFIRLFPNIYLHDGETVKLIRKRWSAKELMQKSNI